METIPCDGCICLPICINRVITEKGDYSYGYYIYILPLIAICSLIANVVCDDKNFDIIKKFFLEKKGFIQND